MAEQNMSTGTSTRQESTRGPQRPNGPHQKGIVNRVKDTATAQLTHQKDRGIDALGSVAQAIRSSTQQLRDENHDTIANYVDNAANQIETWSRQLKEKEINELLGDVQRLARRQPGVFISAAFALGIVGARFLKSSRPQNDYGDGSQSRRNLYGGRAQMNTAGDPSGWSTSDDDTAVGMENAVLSKGERSEDASSPRGGGTPQSSNAPQPRRRTERS
jgi:hypothetical protein